MLSTPERNTKYPPRKYVKNIEALPGPIPVNVEEEYNDFVELVDSFQLSSLDRDLLIRRFYYGEHQKNLVDHLNYKYRKAVERAETAIKKRLKEKYGKS
jgi:hypothetical protein